MGVYRLESPVRGRFLFTYLLKIFHEPVWWVLGAVTGVFAVLQAGTALNPDHAWLLMAASRLLAGGTMTGDFYDPNPPLGILVYVPAVLIHLGTGLPLWHSLSVFLWICFMLSVWAVLKALRLFPGTDNRSVMVILAGYVLAGTWVSTLYQFGQRDAIVVWGLFPFLLIQMSLTKGVPVRSLFMRLALLAGAAAVLIKPHYGLLPALMIVHRMYVHRRFRTIFRDIDFQALAVVTAAYLLVVAVFFSDYPAVILPDLFRFYLGGNQGHVWVQVLSCLVIVAGLFCIEGALPRDQERRDDLPDLFRLFCFAALASIFLFAIQMKGYSYHLIPVYVFLWPAAAIVLLRIFMFLPGSSARASGTVAVGVIVAAALLFRPDQIYVLKHKDYPDTGFARLASSCAPPCSYFVLSPSTEGLIPAALYTGTDLASRFPVFWWLWPLMAEGAGADDPAMAPYMKAVVEDLRRYRPDVIAVVSNFPVRGDNHFDHRAFLTRFADFDAEMKAYDYEETISENLDLYSEKPSAQPPRILTYDVYRRR